MEFTWQRIIDLALVHWLEILEVAFAHKVKEGIFGRKRQRPAIHLILENPIPTINLIHDLCDFDIQPCVDCTVPMLTYIWTDGSFVYNFDQYGARRSTTFLEC